jgi:hypothetical protein
MLSTNPTTGAAQGRERLDHTRVEALIHTLPPVVHSAAWLCAQHARSFDQFEWFARRLNEEAQQGWRPNLEPMEAEIESQPRRQADQPKPSGLAIRGRPAGWAPGIDPTEDPETRCEREERRRQDAGAGPWFVAEIERQRQNAPAAPVAPVATVTPEPAPPIIRSAVEVAPEPAPIRRNEPTAPKAPRRRGKRTVAEKTDGPRRDLRTGGFTRMSNTVINHLLDVMPGSTLKAYVIACEIARPDGTFFIAADKLAERIGCKSRSSGQRAIEHLMRGSCGSSPAGAGIARATTS